MFEHTQFVEKYRPQKVEDCILPKELITAFSKMVEQKDILNMLLTGKPGVGKTTIAKALCNELNCDVMIINGSDESGIDTFRNKIKTFASTVSLSGGLKVIIIDEADYLNANSTQPAMRSFMEEYSANCRFILTCNYKAKIIEALISRLTVFEFVIPTKEKKKLAMDMLGVIEKILVSESIQFDKKVLVELIIKFFPDFRKTISEIQRYAATQGKIDVGILSYIQSVSTKELVGYLKGKNFTSMRKWINENLDNDTTQVIRSIYDGLEEYLEPVSIPQAIIILAEYQHKAAFVADQEINLVAMLINIMAECVFK